jgi:hypothetical protein
MTNANYRRLSVDLTDEELDEIQAQKADMQRRINLHIQMAVKDEADQIKVVRRRIEQAELDAIAKQFEEEERQERLESMGMGNWA